MFWKKNYTLDELLDMIVKKCSFDISNDGSFKDAETNLFVKIAEIDGANEYFTETMARDIKRYFSAQTQSERDQSRGAFARTAYFKGLLGMKQALKKDSKIVSRYAK